LEKLQSELDAANLSHPISYREAEQTLPYLQAVIKESMRLHPGVGLLLERVVPDGGVRLPGGPYLEGGVCVGMNAWVVHLHDVFGPTPEAFRPERWLPYGNEPEERFKSRVRQMNDADLVFGGGRRVCSGKFVAQVEMVKVLATLFSRYELELLHPTKEMKVKNSWFVRQGGIDVRIKTRQK
jgi:cytochrome P450